MGHGVWKRKIPVFGRMSGPAMAFALMLGILIWMKLRLVTGLPRQVYAEPPVTPPTPVKVDTADQAWRRPAAELTIDEAHPLARPEAPR